MRRAYFSFGFGHAHRVNGFTYDTDILVEINAEDPRAVMVETFGTTWSMEYHEPTGMNPLPLPEECARFWPRGVKILPGYGRDEASS